MIPVWLRRLWLFIRRERAQRDLREEMQLHLELRARALEGAGLSPAEARRAARRRFGHELAMSERSQQSWGFRRSDELRLNLRYALRRLRQRPAWTMAIVLVMGLGIGATTGMFSAVDAALLRDLPFREPGRLVHLPNVEVPFEGDAPEPVELPSVMAMPELFASVAAYAAGRLNLSDDVQPMRVRVGVVTDGFFRTLGIDAALGRTFAAGEGVPGAGAVVILSDALWRQRFGARAMPGETIVLDEQSYEVIGVMPPGFSFPEESQLWIPMSVPNTRATLAPFGGFVPSRVLARLADGVPLAVSNARLLDLWEHAVDSDASRAPREVRERIVAELRGQGAVRPLQASLTGTRARALLVLLGATGLLLLIACANVTGLLLSDAAGRRREVSLRRALGASRGRIVRQVLIESVVLAGGGVVIGLVIAPVVLGLVHALIPARLAGVADPRIDWRVLGFASSLGFATALGFGLWPARVATRNDPADALRSGGSPRATGRRDGRSRRVLITVELALTLMLLVGSGLLLRTFAELMRTERGMETANTGALELSFGSATTAPVRLARIEAMLERLRSTPGIASAGVVNDLPLAAAFTTMTMLGASEAAVELPVQQRGARYLTVSPGYFEALGVPLRGRDFDLRDDAFAPPTVIINEALARRWFPGMNALGRWIATSGPAGEVRYTVIGVVGDMREVSLGTEAMPQIYHPIRRVTPRTLAIVARGPIPPRALLAALRSSVEAVDPAQPVTRARMMDAVVRESVASQRTNALLISLFSALAVLLAAVGVYSLVAQGVTQRARELGIRSALGASGADLLAIVSREVMAVVAIGIAAGLAGAWAAARVVRAMVYGVSVHDPLVFALGSSMLAVIAIAAAVVPLRRVLRMDPVAVIRSD